MRGQVVLSVAGWGVAAAVGLGMLMWRPVCDVEPWRVPEGVAAVVDGQRVLWEDVELDVLGAMAQSGIRFEGEAGRRQVRELRLAMRERAVERELLVREARRRGYRVEVEDLRQGLERLRSQVPEGTLLSRMVREGRWEGVLRRRVEANRLVEALVEALRAASVPSEAEIRGEYEANLRRYWEGEAAYFRQVVTEDRRVAELAARRIRGGESMERVGEELAADRGVFERGAAELRMFRGNPDPREPVLFRLKPGEVSDPVEVPGGFAVVRLERRTPARQVPFEEVRDRIAEALHARKAQTAIRELVKGLRSRAKIERLPLPEEASTPPGSPVPSPRP